MVESEIGRAAKAEWISLPFGLPISTFWSASNLHPVFSFWLPLKCGNWNEKMNWKIFKTWEKPIGSQKTFSFHFQHQDFNIIQLLLPASQFPPKNGRISSFWLPASGYLLLATSFRLLHSSEKVCWLIILFLIGVLY